MNIQHEAKIKIISILSGVPQWFIETGEWMKHPEMVRAIRSEKVGGLKLKDRFKKIAEALSSAS